MKPATFLLCVFATFCLIVVKARRFNLPDDLPVKYVNVSYTGLFQSCKSRNLYCRGVVARDTLELSEKDIAELIIDKLAERARHPLMNKEQWRRDLDQFCLRDGALRSIFEVGMKYIRPCVPELASRKKGLENFMRDFTLIYCSEVERIAKRVAGL